MSLIFNTAMLIAGFRPHGFGFLRPLTFGTEYAELAAGNVTFTSDTGARCVIDVNTVIRMATSGDL